MYEVHFKTQFNIFGGIHSFEPQVYYIEIDTGQWKWILCYLINIANKLVLPHWKKISKEYIDELILLLSHE